MSVALYHGSGVHILILSIIIFLFVCVLCVYSIESKLKLKQKKTISNGKVYQMVHPYLHMLKRLNTLRHTLRHTYNWCA